MTVLSFDTSTAVLAAAITRGGAVLDSSLSFTERNHAVRIVSELKELLERNGLSRNEVDAIAAGQGPGSYTGVRIAVTAAKTLAWTWNKPLVGISSLEALAFGAWKEIGPNNGGGEAWIVPLMDGRRGQAYGARFAALPDGSWRRTEEDGIRLFGPWLDKLKQAAEELPGGERPSSIVFVGQTEPFAELVAAAAGALADAGISIEAVPFGMDAGAVGLLAERRIRGGEKDEPHAFVPNYTQLAEAEAKLLAAQKERKA
ncbi:tRNA (adenosine(37)-N6)-threonylcarbamoyltransferase complex dimerization subunit type 1 TsaB [Cohnella algarum]|nr:tRNA (adenosine(37)-N6)-threonylcarbamoyltransferase complex dimerization subunit type 1 TsaB [Cohnella algarum]MBN2980246.1 tRNA (adenosine(37)-N6)-threonylcarbamoyltransferase complex dimerization subunit type 1 TsaB [Cohnella algarum]